MMERFRLFFLTILGFVIFPRILTLLPTVISRADKLERH